ncbi:hypothetical protein PPMP20_24655 [Paraburkholderia phymatum]|uniref:hypothetical protein n=1 Tax=Paraburkholderia phymatum TaxID=148447 RepID=UPI0012FE5238|nr:hypothetical protein [Paraburkholderia phymatum]
MGCIFCLLFFAGGQEQQMSPAQRQRLKNGIRVADASESQQKQTRTRQANKRANAELPFFSTHRSIARNLKIHLQH